MTFLRSPKSFKERQILLQKTKQTNDKTRITACCVQISSSEVSNCINTVNSKPQFPFCRPVEFNMRDAKKRLLCFLPFL